MHELGEILVGVLVGVELDAARAASLLEARARLVSRPAGRPGGLVPAGRRRGRGGRGVGALATPLREPRTGLVRGPAAGSAAIVARPALAVARVRAGARRRSPG